MSAFERIYKFVSAHFDRIPKEDLVTEFLAGVLESDKELLDRFVKDFLGISGEGFSVSTQQRYEWNASTNGSGQLTKRPDMVFENEDTLCFLENKIAEQEGAEQLSDYYKLLQRERPSGKYFLRYCTKYHDPKNNEDYGGEAVFRQFRWADIAKFLAEQEEQNTLMKQFLDFLKRHGMGQRENYTSDDAEIMNGLFGVMTKMESTVAFFEPCFTKNFGKPVASPWERQILHRNRYGLVSKDGVLSKTSSVFAGFAFNEKPGGDLPTLQVLLWCELDGQREITFRQKAEAEGRFKFYPWGRGSIGIALEWSLSNFLSSEKQAQEIESWFLENIECLRRFMDSSLEEFKESSPERGSA